jgi:predicted metal-dependent phosphoesterase TrpH
MHTTASDGRCTPAQLVDEAAQVGLTVMAVTDHDTVASTGEVRSLALAKGIDAISGIEITAVEDRRDVHVLGYFCDTTSEPLAEFLRRQRETRRDRIQAIADRLADLGVPIDPAPLLAEGDRRKDRSLGRPLVARALIDAGHVTSVRDAFDRWLAYGRPAFVPRAGDAIGVVVEVIHEAGGLASLAHPGITRIDGRIPALRDVGLDALEVYHPSHDAGDVERYSRLAADHRFLATAGSDYHGDLSQGRRLGMITLPEADWQRLSAGRAAYG